MFNLLETTKCIFLVGLLLSAPIALSEPAASQSTYSEVPRNATSRSYGRGWDCDLSYRKVNESCEAIVMPKNVYPTDKTYWSGWACKWGYLVASTDQK